MIRPPPTPMSDAATSQRLCRLSQGDVKVAVTAFGASIVTTHNPVPEHAPDQPEKLDPFGACAVRVTSVPDV